MICPGCGDEFREGIVACPDCDIALVHELPPERPPRVALLETTNDPDRLAMLLERLETALVPYVVEAGTALSLLDGEEEESDELPTPEPWQARIFVPGSLTSSAADAIARATPESPGAAGPEEVQVLDPADLKNPLQPR